MARPLDPNHAARRKLILDKAAELFSEHRFHGASIADLAAACEISKSSIYHYYGSKEDILYAVMVSHLARLETATQAILETDRPPAEKLRELTLCLLRLYIQERDRQRVVLEEVNNLTDRRRSDVIDGQRRLIRLVEQLFCGLQPSLANSPHRRRGAAMLFFGMINWTHTWFNPNGALTAKELADMAGTLLLGGLEKLDQSALSASFVIQA